MTQINDGTRDPQASDEYPGAPGDDLLDLPGEVTRHGREQVDAERPAGPGPDCADLLHHLACGHGRRAQAAEAARLADGHHEIGAGHTGHPCQHDGVLDAKHVCKPCPHNASRAGRTAKDPGGTSP